MTVDEFFSRKAGVDWEATETRRLAIHSFIIIEATLKLIHDPKVFPSIAEGIRSIKLLPLLVHDERPLRALAAHAIRDTAINLTFTTGSITVSVSSSRK